MSLSERTRENIAVSNYVKRFEKDILDRAIYTLLNYLMQHQRKQGTKKYQEISHIEIARISNDFIIV